MKLKNIPNGAMWQSTRKHFLDGHYQVEVVASLYRSAGEYGGAPIEKFVTRYDFENLYRLPFHPDYAVAQQIDPSDDPRRVLLVEIDDEKKTVVGGIDEWGLYVDEAHRGMKLGGWLAWAGMSLSGELTTDYALYSEGGYAAFAAAHKIAVDIAITKGLDVPQEVVDEPGFVMPSRGDDEDEGYTY